MSESITISKALTVRSTIISRTNELISLRDEVSKRDIFDNGDRKEPLYDVVKVDEQITKLKQMLLDIDSSIKESNARTKLDVNFDVKDILAPISK